MKEARRLGVVLGVRCSILCGFPLLRYICYCVCMCSCQANVCRLSVPSSILSGGCWGCGLSCFVHVSTYKCTLKLQKWFWIVFLCFGERFYEVAFVVLPWALSTSWRYSRLEWDSSFSSYLSFIEKPEIGHGT